MVALVLLVAAVVLDGMAVVAVEDGPPDCQRTISRSMRTPFPI